MTYFEHEYFPPSGSRFKWNPASLRRGPWWFRHSFKNSDPRSCVLYVALSDKGYRGTVIFYNTAGVKKMVHTRYYQKPIYALKATEALGDKLLADENRPVWADEALALGWRVPCSS